MDIWSSDKLTLFIMFIVPGFISIKIYDLLYPSSEKSKTKSIIDCVTFSCITYIIWVVLLDVQHWNWITTNHFYKFFAYIVYLFITPIALTFSWKKIRELKCIDKRIHDPIGSPWDKFFSQKPCCWIIVSLKNGEKIAGFYGEKSFTSGAPAPEQIYLEETVLLDAEGNLTRKVNNSLGVMILRDEISSLEFIKA